MNKWDISGALGGADPKLVEAAAPEKARELMGDEGIPKAEKKGLVRLIRNLFSAALGAFRKHKFLRIAVPVLAVLALAVILDGTFHIRSGLAMKAYALGEAEHPEKQNSEEYSRKVQEARGSGISLADFFTRSMAEILGGAETEGNHANRLYSPINSYMALAILAECTGGESREEILQLLGADSIESLRKQASDIYLANSLYSHEAKSVLSNSIWLSGALSYREDTVQTLAGTYYASSFRGEMGTSGYDKALRSWIKEATDGLLPAQYVDGIHLEPDTVMALVSTLNLNVKWDGFKKNDSRPGTFFASDGERTVTYMKQVMEQGQYVLGSRFQATCVPMGGGMKMWLVLPNDGPDGLSPEELLQDETYQSFLAALMQNKISGRGELGDDLAWQKLEVHLTLPRFDITAEYDLKESFRKLGLVKTLSFDEADFSGLTEIPSYLSRFKQASRLIADEEGIRGVSFTFADVRPQAMMPNEVVLIFNRPFLFLLMSADNLPLYAGIVNEP